MSWLSKTIKKTKKSLKKITTKNVLGKVAGGLTKLTKLPIVGSVLNTASGGLIKEAAKGLNKLQGVVSGAKKITSSTSIEKIAGGLLNGETNKTNNGSNLSSAVGSSSSYNADLGYNPKPKRSVFAFLGKTAKKWRKNG